MRLHHLTTLFLLPTFTLAHFTLVEPATVYTIPNTPATIAPCGYATGIHPSYTSNTTSFTGNPAAFLNYLAISTHGSATWNFKFILDPSELNLPAGVVYEPEHLDLYRTVETKGDGTFCLLNAGVAEDVAAEWGVGENKDYKKKGWVSVMGEMEDGTFYQCAYVVVSNVILTIWSAACKNDTGVSVKYAAKDGSDNGTSTTTLSATISSTSGPDSTTTQTSTDSTTSTSDSTTDITSITSPGTAAATTGTSTSAAATVSAGAATGRRASNSLSVAGLLAVFGVGMMI